MDLLHLRPSTPAFKVLEEKDEVRVAGIDEAKDDLAFPTALLRLALAFREVAQGHSPIGREFLGEGFESRVGRGGNCLGSESTGMELGELDGLFELLLSFLSLEARALGKGEAIGRPSSRGNHGEQGEREDEGGVLHGL